MHSIVKILYRRKEDPKKLLNCHEPLEMKNRSALGGGPRGGVGAERKTVIPPSFLTSNPILSWVIITLEISSINFHPRVTDQSVLPARTSDNKVGIFRKF